MHYVVNRQDRVIKIDVNGKDSQWYRCLVTAVFGDRGYGFARCGKDSALFHIGQGMVVEAGREGPEFRTPRDQVRLPSVGTKIIAIIEETHDGFKATAWALFDEYLSVKAKMESIRLSWAAQAPKPAPTLPSKGSLVTPRVQTAVPFQSGTDGQPLVADEVKHLSVIIDGKGSVPERKPRRNPFSTSADSFKNQTAVAS